jgi:hypothetical protein
MDMGKSLSILDGIPNSASQSHCAHERVQETKDNLARSRLTPVSCVIHATHCSGQTGNSAAATKAVFLQEQDIQTLSGSCMCRRNPGRATTDHQNIANLIDLRSKVGGHGAFVE